MAIQRKSSQPAGITNESGQPEIVLEIDGLTLSMTPPAKDATKEPDHSSPDVSSPDHSSPDQGSTDDADTADR